MERPEVAVKSFLRRCHTSPRRDVYYAGSCHTFAPFRTENRNCVNRAHCCHWLCSLERLSIGFRMRTIPDRVSTRWFHGEGSCYHFRARSDSLSNCEGSICFLPKSRASADQAPGPIIARLRLMQISPMGAKRFPGWEKAIQASAMAATAPAEGVYNPIKSRTPAPAAMASGAKARLGADHAEVTPP